jgi:hypothetical protein
MLRSSPSVEANNLFVEKPFRPMRPLAFRSAAVHIRRDMLQM